MLSVVSLGTREGNAHGAFSQQGITLSMRPNDLLPVSAKCTESSPAENSIHNGRATRRKTKQTETDFFNQFG